MKNRTILLASILFIVIVVGMFAYAYMKRGEQVALVEDTPSVEPVPYADIERIDATHFYIDGVHTIVGEFNLPTPCDLLESDARVAESMPEQIFVDFTVINTSEVCAQVVTAARFKQSATASAEATWSATFMGRPITINLIEATPGSTPDDFEVYIKG